MYTFNDWLEDRITEKSQFPDTYLGNDYPLLCVSELVSQGKMDKATSDLISDKQMETFEKSVVMNITAFKKMIKQYLQVAIDPKEFLESQLHKLEEIRNNNYDAYHNSNIGIEYHYITGGIYKRISDEWENFQKESRYTLIHLGKANEDINFRMFVLRLKINYVEEELIKLDKVPDPLNAEKLTVENEPESNKTTIPARVLCAYIMVKKDCGDYFTSENELQRVIDDVGASITVQSLRTNLSDYSSKKQMKEYLLKRIHNENRHTGYDILATMPKGSEIVKHINTSW